MGCTGMLVMMDEHETTRLPEEVQREIFRSLRGTGKQMDLCATGASMAPLIRAGMRVSIEFVSPGLIRPGDVVLFERRGSMILHRVIGRDSATGSWVEKGDHQPFAGTIRPDDVWGRMAPAGSRWVRRLITVSSRLEWGLYRMKTHLIGERSTLMGRVLIKIGSGLRRTLSRFTG